MQAVVLAAGKSSRFYPLSNNMHKSMIRLCGKPILEYTLTGLRNSGIKEVILIVDAKGIIPSYFGDGKRFEISITYVVQPKPLGSGNGLLLAKKYIKDDFILLNGHHVDIGNFTEKLIKNRTKDSKAVLLVKQKENTWENGVVKIANNRLEELIEKPPEGKEPSKLCIIGIYLFSKDFLRQLQNTPEEHNQLERAISSFAKKHHVYVIKTEEDTITLKYAWDLLDLKNFLFKAVKKSIGENVKIANSAEIIGDVAIEDEATIMEGAKIKGPCFIGRNAYIGNNAILRNGVDIAENSVIGAYMEVKNSVIMANSKTHSGFIGDSIISEDCRIGAQFCTANVRLDRATIKTDIHGQTIDTGKKFLGVIIGKNVRTGIKSSTMPGIIIGENAIIGPSTTVFENVDDNTKYYAKFQKIITQK